MVPPRFILISLGLLFCSRFALGQTVINSTFLSKYPASGYSTYADPNHWSPAEVPNNTATKQFNVNIDTTFAVGANIDVTISNLTLIGPLTGLGVNGKTFAVTGTTTNRAETGVVSVEGTPDAAAKFDAGTLANFSDHTLGGNYRLRGILQFRGADIWTFRDGGLDLGPLSAVRDEFGNDGLRNLARLGPSATLYLSGRDFVTNAPFLNEGILSLSYYPAVTFTAAASLRNFDSSTGTMTGGRFELVSSVLRFPGADIVNLGSVVILGSGKIADLNGNDGLRSLAHILPGGSLTLGSDFTTVGSFTNDGSLAAKSSTFTVTGPLTNFSATSRTLSGGSYSLVDSVLKFPGADIVHNHAAITLSRDPFVPGPLQARISDLAGNDALRNFNDNLAAGSFTLSPGNLFVAPGNFTNAGTVTTGFLAPAHDNRTRPEFRVPAGSSYTQTSGATVNAGTFTADNINILGGSFLNRAVGYPYGVPYLGFVKGSLNVTQGIFFPSGTVSGNLALGANARFHPTIGIFNDSVFIQGSTNLGGTLEVELTGYRFPANSEVLTVLQSSGAMTGTFSNAANGARINTIDGSGSFVVVYESNKVKLTSFELSPQPAQLLNISTRALLSRGDEDPEGDRSVLIAGFIISGSEPKKVVVRGLGPSLTQAGVSPALDNPTLELHAADGSIITKNDDWRDTQAAEIAASGFAPKDNRESALLTTLAPGAYSVVIREKTGQAGTGLVEVFDISTSGNSKLANISTRGFTDSANVLIGGIIAGGPGQSNAELVVRARGPGLIGSGISNAVSDPTLELRDMNGNLIGSNDNWSAIAEKIPATFREIDMNESALRVSLPRGNYTALVRGKSDRGGIALVEVYDLRP